MVGAYCVPHTIFTPSKGSIVRSSNQLIHCSRSLSRLVRLELQSCIQIISPSSSLTVTTSFSRLIQARFSDIV
jgi:hypothetical protein